MASPYQIAGVRASLADLMQKSNLQQQQSQRATSKQMGEMQEKFEDELEKLQSDAREKADRNKGILKAIKIAGSIFGTPLISALTGAAVSGKKLYDQKRGAEMLLNKDMQERYGNTFLRRGMKDFTRMAEDAQISSGDIARGAFGSGLSSMLLSKLMGADKDSSVYDRYKEGRQASKLLKSEEGVNLKENIINKFENVPEFDMTKPVKVTPSGSFSPSPISSSTKMLENKLQEQLGFNVSLKAAESSFPGITNILESITGGEGLKTGMENLQSAIMLPMLLQQLLGE